MLILHWLSADSFSSWCTCRACASFYSPDAETEATWARRARDKGGRSCWIGSAGDRGTIRRSGKPTPPAGASEAPGSPSSPLLSEAKSKTGSFCRTTSEPSPPSPRFFPPVNQSATWCGRLHFMIQDLEIRRLFFSSSRRFFGMPFFPLCVYVCVQRDECLLCDVSYYCPRWILRRFYLFTQCRSRMNRLLKLALFWWTDLHVWIGACMLMKKNLYRVDCS